MSRCIPKCYNNTQVFAIDPEVTMSISQKLLASTNTDEAEAALELLTVDAISSLNDADAASLSAACSTVSANEGVSNAKLRRRLKRAVESIASRATLEQAVKEKEDRKAAQAAQALRGPPRAAPRSSNNNNSVISGAYSAAPQSRAPVDKTPLCMADAIQLLLSATVSVDVEAVLNRLALPAKDTATGMHAPEFLQHRESLQAALDKANTDILLAQGAAQRVRRRLARLLYSLTEESARPTKASKLAAQAPVDPAAVTAAAAAALATAREAAAAAADASTPAAEGTAAALDTVLASLQEALASCLPCRFGAAEEADRSLLAAALGALAPAAADDAPAPAAEVEGVLVLAAREKRRVKRTLQLLAQQKQQQEEHAAKVEAYQAALALAEQGPLAAAHAALTAANSQEAVDSGKLLEALVALPAAADIDPASDDGKALLQTLQAVLSLTITAPIKRRVSRAISALENEGKVKKEDKSDAVEATEAAAGGGGAAVATATKTVMSHNPPAGPQLDGTITAVREAKTADELDVALKDVRADSGNMRSRRALRRALATATGEGTELHSGMNAKQRRVVSRVVSALEGKAESGVKAVVVTREEEDAQESKKRKADAAAYEDEESKRAKKGPYVLFIGQLAYSTTAADVETLVRRHGLDAEAIPTGATYAGYGGAGDVAVVEEAGPVQVRLLTDTDGNSRGSAFAEVQTAEHLHRALGLHHTLLHGRRINVEKSCGGRNKEARKDRLSAQREEQAETIRTKIHEILASYADKGAPSVEALGSFLCERLYANTVHTVTDVLERFITTTQNGERTVGTLDRLLTEAENKATRASRPRSSRREGEEGMDDAAALENALPMEE